jgi:cysteinyl-tRNA synthetase
MGKSYNNFITLTEMFSGSHPLLEKAYSPMTIRFFILQTHYRSTLDFSNEALQAAEKGLKRLMEAYEWLVSVDSLQLTVDGVGSDAIEGQSTTNDQRLNSNTNNSKGTGTESPSTVNHQPSTNPELDTKVTSLLNEFDGFINDDFSTAKVLANIFELVPVINSIKDKNIEINALSQSTFSYLQSKMKVYVEDILGLQPEEVLGGEKLKGAMQVLIDLRRQARAKKDWMTSDAIRNQLAAVGILLKDEKNGAMSWNVSS